ncbi:hypothetical protein [Variovorax sp. IB41]|uniref:hypothetical protein n=1 Tax=Variovorax sp. IB41 TaxID=2779370 RepID=UPI0018E71CEC|nr:hypothetical protein [Variovorax sp. IB41]MBJ2155304.1 hypothetical protein [Variovorax sp. IB41]
MKPQGSGTRKPLLRLVPKPRGTADADWIASRVMENLDQAAPGFWDRHPVADRGSLRNIIVRVVMAEAEALGQARP